MRYEFEQIASMVSEDNKVAVSREKALKAAEEFKAFLEGAIPMLNHYYDVEKAKIKDFCLFDTPFYMVSLGNDTKEFTSAKFYYIHDEISLAKKAENDAESASNELFKMLGF